MPKAKPKLDGLEAAVGALNESREYRKLGNTDVTLALSLGDVHRLVKFEAFEIAPIEEIDADATRDAELVLEMSAKDWNAYLRQRKAGKGDSLLSLDLATPGGVVHASNPLAKLKFERFNRSLQAFVDEGARLTA